MSTACAACGQENREGRKFCAECGASLTAPLCPTCGAANEPGEKFCGDCGAGLVPGSVQARAPVPALPIARELEGERKQLTVLFADVQGSMDLQENLDPETWAGIMGRFVQILAEGVGRFGGTVDKFTGDGIMALFGAPVAQEDHARRACHAAWHLAGAIASYAVELRGSGGPDLHVRLGLNSGEVVVGRVGEDVRLDPTALGHTVGLAQRMEALAEPGRAYLTEHTARLVEGWFRLTDLGPTAVKGVREPLGVFALEGPAQMARSGRASRLVGRSKELAALEDALVAATEGRAQVVGVVGEAGVGKSALCEEFARAAAENGITVRRTTGVSHGKGVPLLPILALLRDYFGVTTSNSPDEARDQIAGRLLALDSGFTGDLPLLFDFLEVPARDSPGPNLSPEVRMRRIFEVLRRVTERRSEREALVLVVEDLHWLDPQSEAFLERLIESFPGTRTLVVTNFRPEFSAAWMRHSYYRQLPLAPLRDDAVGELLGGLLGVDLSLAPLLAFVLERTGGNPFFVEEVVRALIGDGALAGDRGAYRLTRPLSEVRVPPSVQAVLAARIDRLPAGHKALLQTAAVIGRTFPEPVLATVTGQSGEELEDGLRALCNAELLQTAERHPAVQYRFWHPLTQEVAYGSLLAGRKARLHASVAEAVTEHDPGRLDEQAAVIAWHWERAGRPLEAAQWSMRAAAFALRSDLGEAQRRWRGTIDLLEGVEETPEHLQLGIQARVRLLQFGARTGIEAEEAERLYEEARARAERLGDPGLLAMPIYVSGSVRFLAGDLQGGLGRWVEAAHLGEQSDDPGFRAALSLGAALALNYRGPLGEGLAWVDRAVEASAGDPDRGVTIIGYSPLVRALHFRAELLAAMGRLAEATQDAQEALIRARTRAEPETLPWTLSILPQLAWLSGEAEGALAAADEAVRIAEDSGNVAVRVQGLEGLGLAYLLDGRPQEAVAACESALAEARKRGTGLFKEPSLLAHLARARLAAGDPAGARAAAEEAVVVARHQGARVVECLCLLTRAHVGRATGEAEDVLLTDLEAALALVAAMGALVYEPFIHEELGRLRADEGALPKALRLFQAIGATGHARRLKTELAGSPQPIL